MRKSKEHTEEEFIITAIDKKEDYISKELTLQIIKKGYPCKQYKSDNAELDFSVNKDFTVKEKIGVRKTVEWYIPTIAQVSNWLKNKGYKVETCPYWINKKIHWQFSVTQNIGKSNQKIGYSRENGDYKTNYEAINNGFDYVINYLMK